jgi:SAM-dependent methyltransferase
VYNYRYENGRTYHSYRAGAYHLPNDKQEQERLDLLHHICKMLLGGELFTAPLPSDVHRILDVGTGTGIWAVDVADRFPGTLVFGTDLSPIQPLWVPPNLKFYVDDAEAEWTWEETEKFDFIHGRALCGGIGDWPRFYEQVWNNLAPGGWVEMQEHSVRFFSDDGGLERATACVAAVAELERASERTGKPLEVAHLHKQWMIDAGFQDVQEVVKKVRTTPPPLRPPDPHSFFSNTCRPP